MAALRNRLSVSALALVVVAGCAPATTTPSIAPSPACTPEAGGTPYPCSQHDYDQMVAKDKLYAEAEAVYRKFLAEDERIYRAGGITEPTPVLLETTAGKYRADAMSIYHDLKALGTRVVGGTYEPSWIKRAPDVSRAGSVVAMTSCIDGSKTVFTDGKGGTETGSPVRETGYFARIGAALKLVDADSKVVKEC